VGLRPADLAGDGLGSALRKQAELLNRAHGAHVSFHSGPVQRLRPEREEVVYRVAQEATHNALRHADPTDVRIDLSAQDGSLVLVVSDDGRGFDPDSGPARGQRRLGLASMRERAQAVGGRLSVVSKTGAGTTVRLEVPTGD
jgi:signal transduction histidine kinase